MSATAKSAKMKQATTTPPEEEEEETVLCLNRNWNEWITFVLGLAGAIVLLVFTGLDWNQCSVIPSLQYMVMFFGIVDVLHTFVEFVLRTDKLRKKHGDCGHPHVMLEMALAVLLFGMAIWGAALTFGSKDKVGSGPDECASGVFYCSLVASAITIAIVVLETGASILKEMDKSQVDEDKNASKEAEKVEEEAEGVANNV